MKRNYITPEASIYDTRLRMPVLVTGSVTDVKMKINNVSVHDYEPGFGKDSFGKDNFSVVEF